MTQPGAAGRRAASQRASATTDNPIPNGFGALAGRQPPQRCETQNSPSKGPARFRMHCVPLYK